MMMFSFVPKLLLVSSVLLAPVSCCQSQPSQPINSQSLIEAVTGNDHVAVSTLLQKGAYVDSRDEDKDGYGRTALMLAARDNSTDIVSSLLAHSASVDLQDNGGMTAQMYAAWKGHNVVVTLLLDDNASVDIQGTD